MSNNNRQNRPYTAPVQSQATPPSADTESIAPADPKLVELESRCASDLAAATEIAEELRATIATLQSEKTECVGKMNAALDVVANLNETMVRKDAATATRKKLLGWLVKDFRLHRIALLLYAMSDICDPAEMNRILDYLTSEMDARDGALVESYRKQVCEMSQARIDAVTVKADSIAKMAEQAA